MTELEKKSFGHAIGLLESFKDTPSVIEIEQTLQQNGVDGKVSGPIAKALWQKEYDRAEPVRKAFDWLKAVRNSIK